VENIRTIFVLDPEGRMVCGSTPDPGVGFADRDYFKQALATKNLVVGTYTKSKLTNAPVLPVAMPLVEEGITKAIVVTGVRLEWLQNRITERGVASGNAVTIADGNGTILARVPYPERFVGTVIPDTFQSLVHSDKADVLEVLSQDGTKRVLGYRPISLPENPLYVSAGFSREMAFAPINRATLINALAIMGGALLSFLAAVFIGNHFFIVPVARIADVMERWRRGETSARTGMTGEDEIASVGAALDRLLDELDCRRLRNEQAEEERTLLMRELAHRVKNGFALVQAIARQTFGRTDADRYRSFGERLAALAGTYDLLLSREAVASSVRELISAALRPHVAANAGRVQLSGPDVILAADLALPLSLVAHELGTNAIKYGSLSSEAGVIAIQWTLENDRLALTWTESGGPLVTPPSKKGFGSVLIQRAFSAKHEATSNTHYRPEGLVFQIVFLIGDGAALPNP
jgi:two-component sensor histidine kinase